MKIKITKIIFLVIILTLISGCSNSKNESETPICKVKNCNNPCIKYRVSNSYYYANCCEEHKCIENDCYECIELGEFSDGKHCTYHLSQINYQEENKIILTDSQIQESKKVVDEYCDLLMSKQSNIISINFTEDTPEIGTIYIMYHCNVVREDSKINPATIFVIMDNEEKFKVLSLDYDEK